jgi:hypothetical protein
LTPRVAEEYRLARIPPGDRSGLSVDGEEGALVFRRLRRKESRLAVL